jgi:purine-nucleoside phosphorylase
MSLDRNQVSNPTLALINAAIKAAARLIGQLSARPRLAIILGSGFHSILDEMEVLARIPFNQLPGFPFPRVRGHEGQLLLSVLGGQPVLILSGRAHFYEGYSMAQITFPVRVLAHLGIQALLITNASGAVNPRFRPGDFMYLADHVNFMGENPLRGECARDESCFTDLTHVYDPRLNQLLRQAARQTKTRLHPGVYLAVSGPTYETPAEIRAFRKLGADAIGMSTVPEAIVARHCGLRVAALACITNFAAGKNPKPISHTEVLAMGESVREKAVRLLLNFVQLYSKRGEPSSGPE